MADMIRKRMHAHLEGDFVVFLIGMRINKWWKIYKWWPIVKAMPRMIRELETHREMGYLGGMFAGFSNPTISIQYWRSFESLEQFARNPEATHLPAWRDFNRRIRNNSDVGIWHEAYLVKAGHYETMYHNLPPFGLGKASTLVEATGKLETARGRIQT